MKSLRHQNSREVITELFNICGITVDGSAPYDIQIHDERLYDRLFAEGTLGFGEAFMDGWYTSEKLDETIYRMVQSRELIHARLKMNIHNIKLFFSAYLLNRQNKNRSRIVGEKHYDLGNDLYEKMLDSHLQYSCGYWDRGAKNLEQAQQDKLQLIGEKLHLKPGMKVLDIGCGWGGLAKYLSEHFKVHVTGITISKEQYQYAQHHMASPLTEYRLIDYRDLQGESFERIVSVGMMEHVGYKNYRTYLKKINQLLSDEGLCLLHTIGDTTTNYASDPWMDKYIFPNGMLPSVKHIATSMVEPTVLEDWHNFGANYDKTLMAWYENFKQAWPELKASGKYDDRFYKMWEYYLLASAASFRTRKSAQLWQMVFSKRGVPGGYKSIR